MSVNQTLTVTAREIPGEDSRAGADGGKQGPPSRMPRSRFTDVMGETHRTDLNELRRMARSRSVVNRTRLAEIIAELFNGGGALLNER